MAATTRRALAEGDGDVLVFLPGAREIDAVAARLADAGAEVLPLHGRQLAATCQTCVWRNADGVAPAGRAGREAPGRVYRCWSPAQHDRLPAQPEPEIAAADLTGFALDLALWGHPDGSGLALPDPPPTGALRSAVATLRDLGAVDPDGRITPRGRALADAGLHPRLARALLDGAPLVGPRRAAEIVALLDDDRSTPDDLVAGWRRTRAAGDPAWRAEVRRLTAALTRSPTAPESSPPLATDRETTDGGDADRETTDHGDADRRSASSGGGRLGLPDDLAAGLVVGLAYPERVARAREPGSRAYLMAGGTAAELATGSTLAGATWLAVAGADRAAGARTARIRAAAPLDEATAREAAATLLTTSTEIGWADGDVVARSVQRLGAIALIAAPIIVGVTGIVVERRLADPDPTSVRAALLDGLRRTGPSLLSWSRGAVELRQRMAFAHAALGDPWPDVSDAALLAHPEQWLDLGSARRRADLAKIDVVAGLRRLLPWSVAGRLDEVAPERLPVPSGSRVRVDYSDPAAPVLAVRVQEAFGWREAPRLADGRVPVLLHLLSPAGRPVAVTRDLASFWVRGYPQVRAELRGRYPRHPWPEDPTTAEPTRRTNSRSR